MEEVLKRLVEAAAALAQGRGIAISAQEALEIAKKTADYVGLQLSDASWRAAAAAGKQEREKIKNEDDAERELRGENNKP